MRRTRRPEKLRCKKNLARAKGAKLKPAPAEQILRKRVHVLEKAQFQRVL